MNSGQREGFVASDRDRGPRVTIELKAVKSGRPTLGNQPAPMPAVVGHEEGPCRRCSCATARLAHFVLTVAEVADPHTARGLAGVTQS